MSDNTLYFLSFPLSTMKSHFKLHTLIILSILLAGCTKELDTFIPFDGSKISVSAIIDPAEGFIAFVSKTAPASGVQQLSELRIDGAEVILYSSSARLLVPQQEDGLFRLTDMLIAENDSFRLEITAPLLDTLRSDWVVIPPAIENPVLEEIVELDTLLPPPFNDNLVELHFSAIDPPGANRYLIELKHDANQPSRVYFDFFADFDTESCEVFNYNSIFFPDKCIENEAWGFTAIPYLQFYDNNNEIIIEPIDYVFTVRSIDENYHSYLLDLLGSDDIRGVILEPRLSTTNVRGGEGLFVASNSFKRVLRTP